MFQNNKLLLSWVTSFSQGGICLPWLICSFGELIKKNGGGVERENLAKQLSSLFLMCLEQISSFCSHTDRRLGKLWSPDNTEKRVSMVVVNVAKSGME